MLMFKKRHDIYFHLLLAVFHMTVVSKIVIRLIDVLVYSFAISYYFFLIKP